MSSRPFEAWQAGIVAALDAYDGSRPVLPRSALDVYLRNSVGARLSVLRGRYPVLAAVLGRGYFTGLASRYVATHASDDADLNRYGGSFPDWMEAQARLRHELTDMPYLGDLARLEQAWSHADRGDALGRGGGYVLGFDAGRALPC